MKHCFSTGSIIGLALFLTPQSMRAQVDYNERIRPIFNEKCTSCHGGVKQAGDVSFIYRSQALATGKSGKKTIEPGKPEASEVVHRISLPPEDDDHMPPLNEHNEQLTPEEIKLITTWIREGAPWGDHWSFQKPKAPPLPEIKNQKWPRADLDRFVLARLEGKSITPSKLASPARWLRRVSFGLTGLPPTPELITRFEGEPSQAMREKIVDDLLASPRFGEHWAAMWMDLARYADSMGYESDDARTIWPYRDWLIQAFNNDMPYDQFTIKQLAGDLLPDATFEDLVATAFHRNTQTNVEGGTDDEEFRIASLVDRVATTWTVWQGVTFGCVQCHSHPYEPFKNREFYEFAAFFNNTADCDLADDFPTVKVPKDPEENAESLRLTRDIQRVSAEIMQSFGALQSKQKWTPLKPLRLWTNKSQVTLVYERQDERDIVVAKGTPAQKSIYEIVGSSGMQTIDAIRIESLLAPGDSAHSPSAAFAVTEFELRIRRAGNHEPGRPFEKVPVKFVAVDEPDGYFWTPKWGAFPNQFHNRWAVIIPTEPVSLGPDDRLSVVLHQNQGRDGAEPPVLRRFALSIAGNDQWQQLLASRKHAARMRKRADLVDALKRIPGVKIPVLVERPRYPRTMAMFTRGNWLNKGDIVQPSTPEIMGGKANGASRLDLAEWIVSRDNPLAARVFVNRVWSQLFGIGIVETLEDFGSTGTEPSHPALLDHLAVRFQIDFRWSLKRLLREIVLSATYGQSSTASPALVEQDPRNRWLARGPRNRLAAEMVRDQALAASGLLSEKMFGPPVMPPQPEGVWSIARSGQKWKRSKGGDQHRRALYTYWRRGAPYPSFETFDMPERKVCSARRITTNTPLQALVTLNDPVYIEASKALAGRMRKKTPDNLREQLAFGYLLACSQSPSPTDLDDLKTLFTDLRDDFRDHPDNVKPLGATPEEAALTVVANTILNLDTALTW